MLTYRHQFTVPASQDAVARFHRRADSMAAITPPPLITHVHQAPQELAEGAEMDFTIWLGPLPLRWLARIEAVSSAGFVDRQLRGPFEHWVHRHTFVPLDKQTTAVVDEIEVGLSRHPLWRLVGLGMWLNLPVLFAYRGWKTRRLLARNTPSESPA